MRIATLMYELCVWTGRGGTKDLVVMAALLDSLYTRIQVRYNPNAIGSCPLLQKYKSGLGGSPVNSKWLLSIRWSLP